MRYDNRLFECQQKKHWESSPTFKQFMPPMLQPKHMVSTPNDDPCNQQDTIQTTHRTKETMSTCKQSLFVLWRTKPHN
jgi:hypothetical protein